MREAASLYLRAEREARVGQRHALQRRRLRACAHAGGHGCCHQEWPSMTPYKQCCSRSCPVLAFKAFRLPWQHQWHLVISMLHGSASYYAVQEGLNPRHAPTGEAVERVHGQHLIVSMLQGGAS